MADNQAMILWDRQGRERSSHRSAFRLFAAVGRRTSDRVAGGLAKARLVFAGDAVAAECDPYGFPIVAAAERAIADAVREVFGPATAFQVLHCRVSA